jgi:Putative esterase
MKVWSRWDNGRVRNASLLAVMAFAMGATGCQHSSSPLSFRVTMPKSVHDASVNGRLQLILSKDGSREPRTQVSNNALTTQQMFGMNVAGLQPDGTAVLDANALGYPLDSLKQIPAGAYYVQAVFNMYETFHRADGKVIELPMDHWEGQNWSTKPGNLYSTPRQIWIDPKSSGKVDISLDKVIPEKPLPKDTKYVKYVRIQSKLLTAFWGRPMWLGAFVILPEGYDAHPDAHYPLIVNPAHFPSKITSFSDIPPDPTLKDEDGAAYSEDGSGPFAATSAKYAYEFYQYWKSNKAPRMLFMAIQHPTPYYDDSYGVNSPNNGPYGDAITQELIPEIEKRFRGIGQPWARALTGCSTGGWEALGMQVKYPDFYNGTWAGAPSPIDFHSWRLVNIYANKNAYYDEGPWGHVPIPGIGNPGPPSLTLKLPSARMEDNQVATTMEQDNRIELVVGDHGRGGGLWDGMQAVFGPVGADGYPAMIWDKKTGAINPEVAKYWQDHSDLGHILERDWPALGPKLVGKIHLTVGTSDQWYLANAVRRVDKILQATKNPNYGGSVEYGDRFVHCWVGDPGDPEAMSTRTVYERQMPAMADRMLKTAPAGADVKSWKY